MNPNKMEQRFQKMEQRLLALERNMERLSQLNRRLNEMDSFDQKKFEQMRREIYEKP